MKIPVRNKILKLSIPAKARLESIIDWEHPLLKSRAETKYEEKLLAAWRAEQGYKYFFDRKQLDKVITSIPEHERRRYDASLRFLVDWVRGKPMPEHKEHMPVSVGPIPFKQGRPFWYCKQETNQELICVANRFAWLPGAAIAVRCSKDKLADEAIFRLIDDWIESCPVPTTLIEWKERPWKYWYHPWAPLNTALRTTNWMMTLHILWDRYALDAERFGRLVLCFRQHLIYLGCVSTRLDKKARGNHFLMEMEGLLNASLFPWLRESVAGREVALTNLFRCANNQILHDGVHVERAPGYHRGCAVWFAMPLLLARLNQWFVPIEIYRRVSQMLEFSLQVVTPDGTETKSGDNAARRDGLPLEQLLAKQTGQKLPFKNLKSCGLLAFVQNIPVVDRRCKRRQKFPLVRHFKYGGFAVARSSWESSASYIFMKLDGYGGGHSHADFLSFNFVWCGRLVIDERGMWAYDNDIKSIQCRLAASHNVLLLGSRDMFEPKLEERNVWAKRLPIVKITNVICKIKRDRGMKAGGKVTWEDGAWWQRTLDFVPDSGLTVVDNFWQPKPEEVTLQFYVRSQKLILDGDSIITADRNKPNVYISAVSDSEQLAPVVSRTEVYEQWFTAVPAWLVRFTIPAPYHGNITTKIIGIGGR